MEKTVRGGDGPSVAIESGERVLVLNTRLQERRHGHHNRAVEVELHLLSDVHLLWS